MLVTALDKVPLDINKVYMKKVSYAKITTDVENNLAALLRCIFWYISFDVVA